jgi:hypothetical protein
MFHSADHRVHYSDLKYMAISPKHYRHAVLHPRQPTRAMVIGAVADALVFGHRTVAVYPGKVRSGKEWEAWSVANSGAITCIRSEYDEAAGVARAIADENDAGAALFRARVEGCRTQVVAQWEAHGLPCAAGVDGVRGGFDAINLDPCAGWIFDMKRTIRGGPEQLQRHALRMLWHAQLAWYVDGARAMGWPVRDGVLGLVEGPAPHDITVLVLSDRVLDEGRKCIAAWCEKLRACLEAGRWPGAVQSEVTWDWAEWGSTEAEEADNDE